MTLNLVVIGLSAMVMLIFTVLMMVTEIGLLGVAAIVLGVYTDGNIFVAGHGGLVWGSVVLTGTDTDVITAMIAILTIMPAALLMKLRDPTR